ncbi:MAG: flagellar hook-length control protein FliK [candidate division Zixibacteria bacterium]|nr:flagellar hook-length control protein FliK [candidate division Zixibacteria bacterium]
MNQGVMGITASPFDMILGFGMQNTPQGTSVTGEFGKLLGALPQFQNLTEAFPGITDVSIPGMMKAPPQPLSDESMQMLLSDKMATILGVEQELPAEQVNLALALGQSEQIISTTAQLVVATDEKENQQLFIKVIPEQKEQLNALMPEMEVEDEKAMLIPMRLRTVEQVGNRLVADAQLRTAAGEDVSVRLKLDIAGNLNGIQNRSGIPEVLTGKETVNAGNQKMLTDLLGNLGVKSLIIENIDDGNLPTSQTVLPKAATKLSGSAKLAPQKALGDLFTSKGTAEVESGNEKIIPTFNSKQNSFMNQNNLTSKQSDFDMLNLVSKTAENHSVASVDFASEAASIAKPEVAQDNPQVRFYNLNNSLEQLKMNQPGQKIQIQLLPAQLGKMELSIVSHRGVVTVNLTLDSMQAKQAVERNLGQLESQLSASGIKVDSLHLHVNESNRGSAFSGSQYYQQGHFSGQEQQKHQFNRFNQELQKGLTMTDESFDNVMVNYLA